MSSLNIKKKTYTFKLSNDNECRVINVRKTFCNKELFIITGINKNEYDKIKQEHTINIVRDNIKFSIEPDDVLCYGDIDFNLGSIDSQTLDTFNWLDNLELQGIAIPANYNYSNHECVSTINRCLYTETFKNSVLCRYLHGCIGKPSLTLIFRQVK